MRGGAFRMRPGCAYGMRKGREVVGGYRAKRNAEAAFFEARGMESGGDNRPTWILVNWLDGLAAGNERDHVCDKVYLSPSRFEGENGREIGKSLADKPGIIPFPIAPFPSDVAPARCQNYS